jgi:hypothetical protein
MAVAAEPGRPGLVGLPLIAAGGKRAAETGSELSRNWRQSLQQAAGQLANLEADLAVDPEEYNSLKLKIGADLTALDTLLKEAASGEPS